MLDREKVEAEEERLRAVASQLPDEQRKRFYRDVSRELRDPDTYAVLNWFFLAGIHHFYLRRWGRGAINLTVFAAGVILMLLGQPVAGIVLISLVSLIELWALFRSQVIVQHWNNRIYRRLLREYDAVNTEFH